METVDNGRRADSGRTAISNNKKMNYKQANQTLFLNRCHQQRFGIDKKDQAVLDQTDKEIAILLTALVIIFAIAQGIASLTI